MAGVIKFYTKEEKFGLAKKIVKEMQSKEMVFDEGLYLVLQKMFLRAKEYSKAVEIVNFAQKNIPNFSTEWYSPIISEFLREGNVNGIHSLREKVLNSPGLRKEITFYNSLINAYANMANSTANLQNIFSEMKSANILPNDVTHTIVSTKGLTKQFAQVFGGNDRYPDFGSLLLRDCMTKESK